MQQRGVQVRRGGLGKLLAWLPRSAKVRADRRRVRVHLGAAPSRGSSGLLRGVGEGQQDPSFVQAPSQPGPRGGSSPAVQLSPQCLRRKQKA